MVIVIYFPVNYLVFFNNGLYINLYIFIIQQQKYILVHLNNTQQNQVVEAVTLILNTKFRPL